MGVCLQEDEFIKGKVRWIAELDNGDKVYQDDDREGEKEAKAWIRLGYYIKENNRKITAVYLQFWDHIEKVAEESDGYYFIRCAGAFNGDSRTYEHYIIGTYNKETTDITTTRWLIPEILPTEKGVRRTALDDPSLIING